MFWFTVDKVFSLFLSFVDYEVFGMMGPATSLAKDPTPPFRHELDVNHCVLRSQPSTMCNYFVDSSLEPRYWEILGGVKVKERGKLKKKIRLAESGYVARTI